MSGELYACVHAREFPAQALLRLRPDLGSGPVAILDGHPPLEQVCARNRHAQRRGVEPGMTRTEVEALAGVHLLRRSLPDEDSARRVMLECAAGFSPRVEDLSRGGSATCVLDIAGTGLLFGPPDALARRIRAALQAAGLHTSVAVSSNFHTARIAAVQTGVQTRGVLVIPPGGEAEALARLDVRSLNLAEEHRETLALWGIRTLGELATLPERDLVARLGQAAGGWRRLALGVHPHLFRPAGPVFELSECTALETPLDQVEPLLFLAARMIECLVERASRRALALRSLSLEMRLEGGGLHTCVLRPALPSSDRTFLLRLVRLELAARPPQAAVTALAISAEPGQPGRAQLGLFAPPTPEPSRLDLTLARLRALAGEDRVGRAVLEDSHRRGAFHMEPFTAEGRPDDGPEVSPPGAARLALRRLRPPRPLRVTLAGGRPASFRERAERYEVTAACGPWRSSGCWWAAGGWSEEEWDVQAVGTRGAAVACLLVRDGRRGAWRLEAFYD